MTAGQHSLSSILAGVMALAVLVAPVEAAEAPGLELFEAPPRRPAPKAKARKAPLEPKMKEGLFEESLAGPLTDIKEIVFA